MHKSRLAGFTIDCKDANSREAADFWGEALGMVAHEWPPEEGGRYVKLVDPTERLNIEVQAVEHASRVHLDIEADDIEAEVRRLEALGAKRIEQIRTWWVMEAPTGQRFCVVRPQSPHFDKLATQWS